MKTNVYFDHTDALRRAIKYFGSQRNLARKLKVSNTAVNHWLNRNGKISLFYAEWIALLTNNSISRFELAPYAKILLSIKHVKPKNIVYKT